MSYLDQLAAALKQTMPLFIAVELLVVPFIFLEQWKPAGERPRPGDYLLNFLISSMTTAISLPIGMAAGRVAP